MENRKKLQKTDMRNRRSLQILRARGMNRILDRSNHIIFLDLL